jgi:hypothetical protein
MKVKRTYRIEQELADKLAKLAKDGGKTATDVLEEAIRAYDTTPDGSHTANDGVTSPDGLSDAVSALFEELSVLHEQLEVKDGQIAALNDALISAQETAKAAQALHAATTQVLALESQEQKLTRWQRLKKAWRGEDD